MEQERGEMTAGNLRAESQDQMQLLTLQPQALLAFSCVLVDGVSGQVKCRNSYAQFFIYHTVSKHTVAGLYTKI